MSAELIAELREIVRKRADCLRVQEAAAISEAADLLSSLALAERGEGNWFLLDPDNLPDRKLLLTNNLTARDAFGQMSHVWIGTPFKADNPERDGSIVTFDEDMVRVCSITHAHELPPAPASGRGA